MFSVFLLSAMYNSGSLKNMQCIAHWERKNWSELFESLVCSNMNVQLLVQTYTSSRPVYISECMSINLDLRDILTETLVAKSVD